MCCCNPYMNRFECIRSRYPQPYGFGDSPDLGRDGIEDGCGCSCHDEDEDDFEDEEYGV